MDRHQMNKKILAVASSMAGIFVGSYIVKRVSRDIMGSMQNQLDKITQYYKFLDKWMMIRQNGITLDQYFREKGYKKIAIYGMRELGKRLIDELRETEIEIVCIIDQNPQGIQSEVEVITPDEKIPDVDVVVVTAFYYFEDIDRKLHAKVHCPIISLEEIVYESRNNLVGNEYKNDL